MITRSILRTILLWSILLPTLPVYAEDGESFWELGLGATFITFPDYVGSDERNYWPLPYPYVVYRSERFNVDRNAATGRLFSTERLELELSLGGSIPVKSDDNDARKDMPDLDPIGEVGPSLEYELFRFGPRQGRLLIEWPVRAAFAITHEKFRHIGWTSAPNLQYRRNEDMRPDLWELSASVGPLFGDRRYFRYFYAVEPKFVTPERPEFDTGGGFGGWRLAAGASRRAGKLWYGAFIHYINIADAEFADSPLVETDHYLSAGVAIAWIFAGSRH